MQPPVKPTAAQYASVPTNDTAAVQRALACMPALTRESVQEEEIQGGSGQFLELAEQPLDPKLVDELLDQLAERDAGSRKETLAKQAPSERDAGERPTSTSFSALHDEWARLGYWQITSQQLSKVSVDEKPRCEPSALFSALHRTMWLLALVWLFFGTDGKGVFNKFGCYVNWTDVVATVARQAGFDTSRSYIEGAAVSCSQGKYVGFWAVFGHLSTFGMLTFSGPIAFSAIRRTTQSVRLEVINGLQKMGFAEEDILTHMHTRKGSVQSTIADLLAPELRRLLLREARLAAAGDIDPERSEERRPVVVTAPHTSACACRVCSILRTAACDVSPLERLRLGQPYVADPEIKSALISAIKEQSSAPSRPDVELTEDGALQVLVERLFRGDLVTGDDDDLVQKAKARFMFRVWIGVPLTALLTAYRLYHGIYLFLHLSGKNSDVVHESGGTNGVKPYLVLSHNLALALCDCTLGYWWVLLQLAVEMTTVQIERVNEQLKRASERFGAHETAGKWEEEWVKSIEKPALRLVRRILPALNDGFGGSLICIVAALTLHAISHVHTIVAADEAFWSQPKKRWDLYTQVVLVSFLTVLPGFLTWSAARISSECDDLMDSLLKQCHRSDRKLKYYNKSWRDEQALIMPLQSALALANENHGPGFMIPVVHAKLSFRTLMSFMIALVVFLIEGVPHLVGHTPENPYHARANIRCPFGWSEVQGKCLRLFGEDSSELRAWDGAEELCQRYGGHLVSIATHEQQLAVSAIVAATAIPRAQAIWIGLRRQSGVMKWVDNTTMEFHDWATDEPDLPADGDSTCVDDSFPASQGFTFNATRDDCGMLSQSSGFRWWDTPCTKTSYKPSVKATSTAVDDCYHTYYPFICQKRALPGEWLPPLSALATSWLTPLILQIRRAEEA